MQLGDKLDNLNLKIGAETNLDLKAIMNKRIIIYFYPKDDTPGCTVEAIDFTKFKKDFEKNNVHVIGISKDSIDKHEKFKNKYNLTIDLASDEDGSICNHFKVWVEKSMYGKKYMGIERATFLFNEKKELIKIWRKVKVKGHVEEVLNSLNDI
ncbi:MAG: peroxiredoxin [Alphaproteobacteria bacterium]